MGIQYPGALIFFALSYALIEAAGLPIREWKRDMP